MKTIDDLLNHLKEFCFLNDGKIPTTIYLDDNAERIVAAHLTRVFDKPYTGEDQLIWARNWISINKMFVGCKIVFDAPEFDLE